MTWLTALLLLAPAAETQADPEATQLLADARAARATWQNFPGFTAQIEINDGGQIVKGLVRVDPDGEVTFDGIDPSANAWALRITRSVVGHRLPFNPDPATPCQFAESDDPNHPLGRTIEVLNDELHSSYQIRGREITVVNRVMPDARFSIITLGSQENEEGKLLSSSFTVNYWNKESGGLTRSESHVQTWTRVGGYDLPELIQIVTAAEDVSAKAVVFRAHKLIDASE